MAAQVLFFTGALGLGVAVGVLYDIFRILRVRLRLPLLGGILDLLFWLVVTAALFLYTVTAGSGEVRGCPRRAPARREGRGMEGRAAPRRGPAAGRPSGGQRCGPASARLGGSPGPAA